MEKLEKAFESFLEIAKEHNRKCVDSYRLFIHELNQRGDIPKWAEEPLKKSIWYVMNDLWYDPRAFDVMFAEPYVYLTNGRQCLAPSATNICVRCKIGQERPEQLVKEVITTWV